MKKTISLLVCGVLIFAMAVSALGFTDEEKAARDEALKRALEIAAGSASENAKKSAEAGGEGMTEKIVKAGEAAENDKESVMQTIYSYTMSEEEQQRFEEVKENARKAMEEREKAKKAEETKETRKKVAIGAAVVAVAGTGIFALYKIVKHRRGVKMPREEKRTKASLIREKKYAIAEAEGLGTKWYSFNIFFRLWFFPIAALLSDASEMYADYGARWGFDRDIDIYFSVVIIFDLLFAVGAILARHWLARFEKKGIYIYFANFYLGNIVFDIVINSIFIFTEDYLLSLPGKYIVMGIFFLLEVRYWKRRIHLFDGGEIKQANRESIKEEEANRRRVEEEMEKEKFPQESTEKAKKPIKVEPKKMKIIKKKV